MGSDREEKLSPYLSQMLEALSEASLEEFDLEELLLLRLERTRAGSF